VAAVWNGARGERLFAQRYLLPLIFSTTSTMTCEHVSDKVCLDVGSAVVAEQSGYHQRGDAAERQKQREAEATEQSEVQRHFDLQ